MTGIQEMRPAPAAPSQRTVFSAERLVVGDGSQAVLNGAIAMRGDRIDAVGALAAVLGPDDYYVDLGKGTILPGLINSHVHLTISHLDIERPSLAHRDTEVERILAATARISRCLQLGVTTVRDVGASDRGLFALREAVRSGELIGSRIYSAGALLCATGGHAYRIGHEADGIDGMRRAAREELKAGADFLKIMADGGTSDRALDIAQPSLSDEEISAVVEVAHRLGRKVTAHAIAPLTIAAAVRCGVDAIEHGYGLDEASAAAMAERGVVLIPTLSVHECVLRQEQANLRSVWWMDQVKRGRELSRQAVALARQVGVGVVAGTDGGSPFNPHENLVNELILLAEVGMSTSEVIHAATGAAAELLGAGDEIGTLAAGRLADVIYVAGDPTADLTVLRTPDLVIFGGRPVAGREVADVAAD